MENKNKGWSTGLPDFGVKRIIKDPPVKPDPKTKSRVINYDKKIK